MLTDMVYHWGGPGMVVISTLMNNVSRVIKRTILYFILLTFTFSKWPCYSSGSEMLVSHCAALVLPSDWD